jgi:hypothetical protein
VGMKVIAENVQTGVTQHTNTSYFTMVAKDADGSKTQVPPLILETDDDIRRFSSALLRRRLRHDGLARMDDYKTGFAYDATIDELLVDQRCNVRRATPASG